MFGLSQAVIDGRRAKLSRIELLSDEDAVKVYQQNGGSFLTIIDPVTLVLKVPAFQCLKENGELKRDTNGVPVMNPDVHKVFVAQNGGVSAPKLALDAWFTLEWWLAPMKLDAREPDTTAFRPIDRADNPATLNALVDWFKDWADESYG